MCPSLWGEGVRPWGGKSAVFADLDLPERRLSLAWFGLAAGVTDVHVHSVEARNRLRKLLTVSPLVCVLVLLWAPCPNLVVMCGIGRSWDVMTVDYVCSHLALLYHGYSKGSCRNFPAFCDTLLAFIFIPFCCLAAYLSVGDYCLDQVVKPIIILPPFVGWTNASSFPRPNICTASSLGAR